MQPICLLGASGVTGVLIARVLAARGIPIVACGRDETRVRAAVAPFGDVVADVRRVDVTEPATLRPLLGEGGVVISAVGPYDHLGRDVVEVAAAQGAHLVDVSGEQSYVRWVHDERDPDARRSGAILVPGAGFTGAIGDLLASVAASAAGPNPDVHIAYTTAGAGRRSLSAGTKRSAAATLGRDGVAYIAGTLEPEPLGEGRRLAWFPRPVGPMHAAAVPGTESITVPRHVPDVGTVRTYLAMSTWKAEALQAVGNASRWEPVRRRVAAWLERDAPPPSDTRRSQTRWACVAEARGEAGIARAWANGHDPYATAAGVSVEVAQILMDGGVPPGAHPPAAMMEPADLLDRLCVTTGLRWSVTRPETTTGRP